MVFPPNSEHGEEPVSLAPDRCTPYRPKSIGLAGGDRPRRLLGVWAHPDDEAYLSAGLMARTVAGGGQVTVVALSDGEAGFPDDDPRPPRERARLRREELTAAMNSIGVTDVRFAGLPDGELNRFGAEIATIARDLMKTLQPGVTITFGPDGMTGHPDHVANSWAMTSVWNELRVGELWYAAKSVAWLERWRSMHDDFGVWMASEPRGIDPINAVFAATVEGAELAAKRRVLGHHASQTAGLAAALGEAAYLDWVAEELFRRPTRTELTTTALGRRQLVGGAR